MEPASAPDPLLGPLGPHIAGRSFELPRDCGLVATCHPPQHGIENLDQSCHGWVREGPLFDAAAAVLRSLRRCHADAARQSTELMLRWPLCPSPEPIPLRLYLSCACPVHNLVPVPGSTQHHRSRGKRPPNPQSQTHGRGREDALGTLSVDEESSQPSLSVRFQCGGERSAEQAVHHRRV